MKRAPALAALLVIATGFHAGAAPPTPASSVAGAREALEKARANLAKAVERIQKDPPSAADLDASRAAVGVLKEAIDAGTAYEGEDLEYAKAVLAARKELRTQRDYVEQRNAKVHIFDKRRIIDGAVAVLKERTLRLESRNPSAAEFEEARAAATALRKAVDEARDLTKQDEKFASYLAEVDAAAARQEKAIDDRATSQQVDKQRGSIEESRRALAKAMGSLGKGASDAQFESADRAAAAVAKCLEEGRALEARDRAYGADADKVRSELAQAKKKSDDLWSATGVERLKAEIEPARKDLAAAGKAMRSKGAAAEQLAEARTAAIVVRKLLEKFAPQAARSQAFGQYLDEVQKALVEIEAEVQRRSLDSPMRAVTQALKPVEGRSPIPTPEQFQAADAALDTLEKTLQPMENPDSSIAALVNEARTLLRGARTTVAKRRAEVSLAAPAAAVAKALRKVEGKSPADEDFKQAQIAIDALAKVLEAIGKPDPSVAAQVSDARELLRTARASAAKRQAETSLLAAREAVAQALRLVEGKSPTEEQFAEANTALAVLDKTIEAGKDAKEASQAIIDARAALNASRAVFAKRRVEVSLATPHTTATKLLWKVEGKAPTDADFEAANAALTALEKVLETIQNPDPSVAARVNDAQVLVKLGRVTWAKRRAEVSLELARRSVAQALRPIEAKGTPSDEQFAEVNTALTILEKTLEAVKDVKEASPAIIDARAALRDSRATVAKRRVEVSVEAPRAAATQALARLDAPAPTDEQFKQAGASLDALDKSLAAVGKPPSSVAALVADAQWLVRSGRAKVEKRRLEVDVQRQREKVEAARQQAAPLIAQLSKAAKEQVQETEAALKQILAALDGGTELTRKDRVYAVYDIEVRKRIAEMNDQIARRKIALAGSDGRALLSELVAAEKTRLHAARQPEAADGEIEAAAKGLDAIRQALEERVSLEEQDAGYAAQASQVRDEELGRLKKDLEFAKQARELRRRTVEALTAGIAASDSAVASKDLRVQKSQWDRAMALFGSCERAAAAALDERGPLASFAMLVDGRLSTPKDVAGLCAERTKATEQLLKQVEAIIGFEDGPKIAFEKGKALLGKSKKREALEQFRECISSGKILLHWHPELKDRKFEVARGSMTVGDLIGECTKQADALQARGDS